MKILSDLRQLPFCIKAAAMIGQRLRVDPPFAKPLFHGLQRQPARRFSDVYACDLPWRDLVLVVFSARAIARLLAKALGIAVGLFASVCSVILQFSATPLYRRNYIGSTESNL